MYLQTAHRVVTESGAPELLHKWKQADRASNAGAKPLIPLTAVLTLFVAHALAGRPITYDELASTLRLRLDHDERVLLGVSHKPGTQDQWYDRAWAAVNRVIALVDPYPGPRNVILRGGAWESFRDRTQTPAYAANTALMLERFDELINAVVQASISLVPPDIWSAYEGSIAIDATRVRITGRPNAASANGDRSNPDPLSGRYTRLGSHQGLGAGTDEAAYELETAVSIWNRPGESDRFPSLVTAVTMHNPGQLIGHGARLIGFHKRLGFDRFLVCVDRAYNGGTIETFHVPARLAGAELVMDYQRPELGLQGWYEDLFMVDGNWHVRWMPWDMVMAGRDLEELNEKVARARGALKAASRDEEGTRTPEQLKEDADNRALVDSAPELRVALLKLLHNRSRYRMKPHGLPDADGAQRYTYPNEDRPLVDATPLKRRQSVTIPMLIPETDAPPRTEAPRPSGSPRKPQPIRFLQKFAHNTPEWDAHYGMRNLVEASNRLLKKGTRFNIADPDQRSGRGYAFTYLSVALVVVADNIHRIRVFFHAEAKRADDASKPKTRARRRKDANGNPLPRRQTTNTGPPR
ncbi:hypothetical protein [Agromyces indicus]|uniref:Transposase n=1 Tax=Agromyces indicus TaxID=758919 RepID=A0ABU1FJA8_9MICO|nr:hypothetical protein [Agromyces indicus]MDR5691819.1 hypothetical protein [Agromyces indicus]